MTSSLGMEKIASNQVIPSHPSLVFLLFLHGHLMASDLFILCHSVSPLAQELQMGFRSFLEEFGIADQHDLVPVH